MPATFLRVLLFLLVVIIGYANSLQGAFVFDDYITIVYNPAIQSLHPFTQIFGRPNDLDITTWGRPLVAISLAGNYALGKLDVLGYHLFNITIHLLNGFLLWLLGRELLRAQKWSPNCAAHAEILSWLIALLWLAHPLATSVTTYIVQRAESLMAFFYLGTLLAGVKFFDHPKRWGWALLAIGTCSSGMMAKESMVTAPISLLLLGWTIYRPNFASTLRQNWWWLLGLTCSWMVLAWAMVTWPRNSSVGLGLHGLSSLEYLLIQIRVLLHYFSLVYWPVSLSINYPQRFWDSMSAVPTDCWPLINNPAQVWPEALALLSIFLLLGWLWWKRPGCGLLLTLVFLLLAPTSSFIPIVTSLAADHRMYLPSAALIALSVIAAQHWLRGLIRLSPPWSQALPSALCFLTLALLLTGTIRRNEDYRDGVTIWKKSLELHPLDALGWNELGHVYFSRGELNQAAEAFKQGSQICDTYLLPLSNLAVCQWNLGQREESLKNLKYVLDQEPDNLPVLRNLAAFFTQIHDTQNIRLCLQLIVRYDPDDDEALEALAKLGN